MTAKKATERRISSIPEDLAAEAGVLASMIQDDTKIPVVLQHMERAALVEPGHKEIFDAILAVHAAADTGHVDGMLVRMELERNGLLEAVGGKPYLQLVLDTLPSSHNAAYYAQKVQEEYCRRRLMAAGLNLIDAANDKSQSIAEQTHAAYEDIDSISTEPIRQHGSFKADYIYLSQVQGKPVHWLWRDRIPRGMLALIVGREGEGKSYASLSMAMHVSRGAAWPDATSAADFPEVGNVIYMTTESHLEYEVKPRLEIMNADCNRIVALRGIHARQDDIQFDAMKHMPALEALIETVTQVHLVIVDPITGFLGSGKQNDAGEMRLVLSRFTRVAEKYGCAVIGISHLNKDTTKRAIHRTLGSGAFSQTARMMWLVAEDPNNKDRRLFVPMKANLSRRPSSLAFHISDTGVSWESEQFNYDPDTVLAGNAAEDDGGTISEVCEWLRGRLTDGRLKSAEIMTAAKKVSISPATLKRAKKRLGVKARAEGTGTTLVWYWYPPTTIVQGMLNVT